MQAVQFFAPSPLPFLPPLRTLDSRCRSISRLRTSLCPPIKATVEPDDSSSADYSSNTSVFLAEACETIGGEACDEEMYPEVKIKPEDSINRAKTAPETVDREYLEYDGPKTVFPGEACDDLGGEFCDPDYQKGVY